MHKQSKWGLVGALTHAILSGRLFRSAAGSGCALCGEHRPGGTFAVLYDKEICRDCVDQAAAFFQGTVEGFPSTHSESAKPCVSCGKADRGEAAFFYAAKGSICTECTTVLALAFSTQCHADKRE